MTLRGQNNRNFVRLKKIIYIAMNSLVVSQVLLIMIKIRKGNKRKETIFYHLVLLIYIYLSKPKSGTPQLCIVYCT